MSFKQEIDRLVADGRPDLAIKKLVEANVGDQKLRNDIAVLSNRYERFNDAKHQGVPLDEEKLNRIVQSILYYAGKCDGYQDRRSVSSGVMPLSWGGITLALLSILTLAFIGSTFYLKNSGEYVVRAEHEDRLEQEEEKYKDLRVELQNCTDDCLSAIKQKIQVMNSEVRGNELVIKLRESLNMIGYFEAEDAIVTRNTLEGVESLAKRVPDLLVAHLHAFEPRKEDLMIEAMGVYYKHNPEIKFLIFSEAFNGDPAKKPELGFTNRLPEAIKKQTSCLGIEYRDPDDRDNPRYAFEVRNAVLKILGQEQD